MNPVSKVLYIDDDPDDLMIFRDFLETGYPGVKLITSTSGEEAIRILNDLELRGDSLPELIVLDLNMPRMDGRQTLKLIRKYDGWGDIRVVIFTTSSNAVDIDFCRSYNTECVTKPGDYNLLKKTIDQIIAGKSS